MEKLTQDQLDRVADRVVKEWLRNNEKIRLNFAEQSSLQSLVARSLNDVQRRTQTFNIAKETE